MKILIIAEAGINHLGDMTWAKEMVIRAKEAGADIFKTQLFDVDSLFPNKEIWAQGRNWYEVVKKTQLTKEQTFQLAEWCREVDIEFMASAFDLERLGWLEEIGVRRHKVASKSVNDVELIEAIKKTGKEVIASVPYGKFGDTELHRFDKVSSLYCIPEYPTIDLGEMFRSEYMWKAFAGFSDHSVGIEASIVAMARGARIIEKHFCLSKDMVGPDIICSIIPSELKELVSFARKIELLT